LKESKKTYLDFDEGSVETFSNLKKALKATSGVEPSNREVFLLAMSYGFSHGAFAASMKRAGNGPRVQYFKPEDQALMAAVQLGHDKSIENLPDMEKRYELAELYAQGGILLLRAAVSDAIRYGVELAAEIIGLLPPAVKDEIED